MEKTGIELIAEERQRQIEVEGYVKEGDEKHDSNELAEAAACYVLPENLRVEKYNYVGVYKKQMLGYPELWPWAKEYWKPTPKNRIRELQKAGALIAAEIDRLQS
jgi:hypothetical protein